MSQPGPQIGCLLISTRTDVVVGDLWLCPDALLRRSIGLRATIVRGLHHGGGQTFGLSHRPVTDFDPRQMREVLLADKRNRWIPWANVGLLRLGHSLLAESLFTGARVGPVGLVGARESR